MVLAAPTAVAAAAAVAGVKVKFMAHNKWNGERKKWRKSMRDGGEFVAANRCTDNKTEKTGLFAGRTKWTRNGPHASSNHAIS